MDEAGMYDEWDLTPLPMPLPSTLYALQPIGMGTPLVESLSSYVIRLAEAHCVFVGMLMRKMVVPLVPGYSPLERQHGLFRESGQRSTLLNGSGLPARYAVSALETLTGRSDLHNVTLLPLAAIFPTRARGLLRLTKAWCPMCYENQRVAGQIIYDPLLWFFLDVAICPEHHCNLCTVCPYQDCARSLPAVGWRARPGYCSYCQRWLGQPGSQVRQTPTKPAKEWCWQQWVTQALGEVLASIPSALIRPERGRISQVVRHAVQQLGAGNLSDFSRLLGMPRNSVDWWYQGERIPECSKLLWFCHRIGLSLKQFLFDEIDLLRFSLQEPLLSEPPLAQRATFDTEQISQALEQILMDNEQPPPTLRMAKQRLKLSYPTLYKVHPAACHEIAARYKAYVQQRKEASFKRNCEEIEQVALKLRSEGIAPTQKRVAPYLSHPGILRNPQVRQYLQEICKRWR